MIALTTTEPLAELPPDFRPITRVEYQAMADLGIFDDQRVELVGGVLIQMAPHKPVHYGLLIALGKGLYAQAGDLYAIGPQGPVALDDLSEPEPDFAVLPPRNYIGEIPSEAHLIIEIANSSLRFDLGEKARRYAARGYPEYWVFDVSAKVVHVHRGPQPDGSWTSVQQRRGGLLDAVAAPPITLDLDALLGMLPDSPDEVES